MPPPVPHRPAASAIATSNPPANLSGADHGPVFVRAAGHQLEYRWFGGSACRDAVVLLHEGLGCVALWRDFPERLSQAAGRPVLAYSRYGYGRSDALAEARRGVAFMHDEALEALPEVLAAFGIERPLLVGHSDGASIALIHAGRFPGIPRGVVALAPHLFVEPISLRSVADIAARFDESDLPDRMRRYHADPIRTFHGWSDIWLDPAFARWNIEPEVAAIECPILAIQGTDDEYGTLEQVRRIRHLHPRAEIIEITGCRHSPHLDAPDPVLAAISRFAAGPARG